MRDNDVTGIYADADEADMAEMQKWLPKFAAIRTKEQEIAHWEAMPEPMPSEALIKDAKLSQLRIELRNLQAQVAATSAHAVTTSEARQAEPQAAPAPVVTASDATPDPERRLASLRKLGGTARRRHGEWRFTGITTLINAERGKKRSDAKTIRADLKEAAQAEHDAKAAGHFDGLMRK